MNSLLSMIISQMSQMMTDHIYAYILLLLGDLYTYNHSMTYDPKTFYLLIAVININVIINLKSILKDNDYTNLT